VNLAGIPAISIPADTANNMPVGLQIMAPQHHDSQLLSIAKAYEELK
jgi:Asp-tRNA(Asn)/Glu-tRNA(Gln) amidotransferase A subunit family amidase